MGWKAPRCIRLKHVVLQNKVFGIGPVVGNFMGCMISHHIGVPIPATRRVIWVDTASFASFGLGNKTIHLSTINVCGGIYCSMCPSMIEVLRIVIRFYTLTYLRIIYANCRNSIIHWNAICSRISPEVGVE